MGWGWCYATLEEFPVYLIRDSWENSAVEWKANGKAMKVYSKCQLLRQDLKGNYINTHMSIHWQEENEYELLLIYSERTHLQLVLNSRKCGSVYPLHHTSSWRGTYSYTKRPS
jgi:hypothetical protein